MKPFRGGLAFKAHRLVYHSTLSSRVTQKEMKMGGMTHSPEGNGVVGEVCEVSPFHSGLLNQRISGGVDRPAWEMEARSVS